MIPRPSPNTQAILLLTAHLSLGERPGPPPGPTPLTLSEYNRLARFLRDQKRQPADLLGPEAAAILERSPDAATDPGRTAELLARGVELAQAVDRWYARSLWILSRADAQYPRRLKARLKEDAPLILYGCGEAALLESGGLAVVGSRNADAAGLEEADRVAQLAARARITIVSGGAKGIDRAAMSAALTAGGHAIGVLSDSLERAALARDNRQPLIDGQLLLLSPYHPSAPFHVGHAMQRNKFIYALADASLIIAADLETGGTWAGAIEQLKRYHFGPLYVRQTDHPGNTALITRGATPWPTPQDPESLLATLSQAPAPQVPQQETLPFLTAPVPAQTPANQLWTATRDILRQVLAEPHTEASLAEVLQVGKVQAKAWLARLAEEGGVEKLSKPLRYLFR